MHRQREAGGGQPMSGRGAVAKAGTQLSAILSHYTSFPIHLLSSALHRRAVVRVAKGEKLSVGPCGKSYANTL